MSNPNRPSDQWTERESAVLEASGAYLGLATVDIGSQKDVTLKAGVSVYQGTQPWNSLGTVSVASVSSGKTFITKPIAATYAAAGNATIFVPTNTFKVTHLALSSDAATDIMLKSGPTYLAGNASVGFDLAASGGLVADGTVEAPVFQGVTAAAGFVVESRAAANVGGYITYFEE